MIQPVNGHLLIEPLKYESFMASEREVYEEIGIVMAADWVHDHPMPVKIGDKIFFDSWLAAKYPKEGGGYYWLVKWLDVRAIEHEQVPE